jgi:hypothetical protein
MGARSQASLPSVIPMGALGPATADAATRVSVIPTSVVKLVHIVKSSATTRT